MSCVLDDSSIFVYECSQLKQKLIDYIKWLKDRGEIYNEDFTNKAEALSDELSEAVDVVLKTVLPVDKWDLGL